MSSEDYTVFVRNLPDNITEPLLYELFLQAGPLEDVRIPTVDGKNRNYGFIVYKHKCSVKYAIDLFKDSKIYGKTISLQNRALDAKREAEMRSRMNNSRRNEDMNSLRGGPLVFSRFNDMNSLRGSPLPNSSRNDMDPLRGGMMGFSRNDMSPMGSYGSNPYAISMDPRFMNPYSNFMNVYNSQCDNMGSPNYDRHGRSQDKYDRNRDNDRDHRRDRDSRRHDRNSRLDRSDSRNGSRHDAGGSRGDRDNQRRDYFANDLRQRLHRSRSRDRSPPYRNERNRR